MSTTGTDVAPMRRATGSGGKPPIRPAVPFEVGEIIGRWTVGERAKTITGSLPARHCVCACGAPGVIREAHLSRYRRAGINSGCRSCAGAGGLEKARAALAVARAERAAGPADQRIAGALADLRDAHDHSPMRTRAVVGMLSKLAVDERNAGNAQGARVIDALLRIDAYAREGR